MVALTWLTIQKTIKRRWLSHIHSGQHLRRSASGTRPAHIIIHSLRFPMCWLRYRCLRPWCTEPWSK